MPSDVPPTVIESWGAVRRHAFRSILISLLLAVIAYVIAVKIPVSYDTHFSYTVSQQSREASSAFRYDGYYSLSATDLFTATLAAWITAPQTIVSAYASAHVALYTSDAIQLTKNIRAEKVAPGLINITVRNASKDSAEAVAHGIATIVPVFIQEQNTAGTPAVMFRAIDSSMWTGVSRIAPIPIALVCFVFVLLVQLILVLLLR